MAPRRHFLITAGRPQAFPWRDILAYLALMALMAWLLVRGTAGLGYSWHWYRVPEYLVQSREGRLVAGPLLQGLVVTLKISALSLVLAFVIGLVTALLRLSHSWLGRVLARGYLEIIRNTPLLVQLFFVYFVLAPILGIQAFASAVLALSLFEGAYASEIFRSGIVSVPRGQWEAARSLGLSPWQVYRLVIFPQALRWILPPLSGQGISLIKDSALVSTIAIYDLTMQGRAIISETYLVFEIWFLVAAIYLVLTLSLSVVVRQLEAHLRIG
ncbi:MAG: amino acid ABC transporter permease [Desulfobacterales bacterium]|jgi:polar amino acid transport system permease protein|nr:amino acid ABC transporter permease [Desulfobacteraceae bacterium]MDD3991896.1 amino acid ABC transporter permease [Desulfobacteraceae bacterium]MDY0312591.1 amino acid ABC transporter permease [Desulfobacterales bacterium]